MYSYFSQVLQQIQEDHPLGSGSIPGEVVSACSVYAYLRLCRGSWLGDIERQTDRQREKERDRDRDRDGFFFFFFFFFFLSA